MHNFNLRHSSFKQALVYAKLLSGMTNEEISEASGIGLARIARYFQEHDAYAPSPVLIKNLCRAMGNTVLVDWINAQVDDLRQDLAIATVQDLTLAVMRATENTGALNSKTMAAINDGQISRQEASALQEQFRKNGEWNRTAADALEDLVSGKAAS